MLENYFPVLMFIVVGLGLGVAMLLIGGVVSLIWHMKQGPPNDSGWDDGAVA